MPEKAKKRIKPVVEEVGNAAEPQVEPVVETPPVAQQSTPVEIAEASAPLPQVHPKKGAKFKINLSFFAIVVIVAVFVALVSGAVYVYFNGVGSFKNTPEESPSPTTESSQTPAPAASASPAPAVNVSELEINVLNGSGKSGEAGRVKALVEKDGFKIAQTGNAATYDYTDTVVQAKTSVPKAAVEKLTKALSASYPTKAGKALPASSVYDIVVTVGSKTN